MSENSQTYDDILPNPGFQVTKGRTAVVITDPQKDFLSEDGVVWQVVGASVEAKNTVEHLGRNCQLDATRGTLGQ